MSFMHFYFIATSHGMEEVLLLSNKRFWTLHYEGKAFFSENHRIKIKWYSMKSDKSQQIKNF